MYTILAVVGVVCACWLFVYIALNILRATEWVRWLIRLRSAVKYLAGRLETLERARVADAVEIEKCKAACAEMIGEWNRFRDAVGENELDQHPKVRTARNWQEFTQVAQRAADSKRNGK
jgi:hypothetical protein